LSKPGGFLFKRRVLGVLAITRSLGDHVLKQFVIAHPAVQERQLELQNEEEPTFLVIACDGLWDVMTDQEAVDLVRNYDGERSEIAGYLVEEAIRRGTCDNVTAIVSWL